MSNRETLYFKEILKEERLNGEFSNLEAAVWNTIGDLGLYGLINGGAMFPSLSASTVFIKAFNAYDKSGRRLQLTVDTTFDFTDDFSGAPTVPSSGHFKWVTAVARYGKEGSESVVDGDGATIYTIQTEGISSTGDVTVDSGAANFGKIRFVQGTESATAPAANRPAVTSPDIIIGDMLIDSTGKVVGGAAGVSVARTDRVVSRSSGAPLTAGSYDTVMHTLMGEWALDSSGIKTRIYSSLDGGTPTFAVTVNARWDGVGQLWQVDLIGSPAMMLEVSLNGLALHNMTSTTTTTWLNLRHDPSGWDARMSINMETANGDVTMDGNGVITGSGPQTAYASTSLAAPAAGSSGVSAGISTGFTWPQEMAAAPSSVTITPDAATQNISGSIHVALDPHTGGRIGGSIFGTIAVDGTHTVIGAQIVAIV